MSAAKLPDGWRAVRFGDVVQEVKVTTRDPGVDGLERIVGLDHLDSESLVIRRWDELNNTQNGTSFTRVFRPGQVLFGKRRAYQRKVAVADFGGVCSSDILVFQPAGNDLLPAFLPFLVQSEGFFEHALGTSAGSLSPRTKWQELARYEFALPPPDEQREIAGLLTASTQFVDALSTVLAAARQQWLALAASGLTDAASSPLEGRASVDLGKKRDPKLLKEGSLTPSLRAANVKDARFELDDVLSMNFTAEEINSFELRAGDVLVTEGCGSLDQIGACAVWNDELPAPICFQMTLLRLRARESDDMPLLQHWAEYSFRAGHFAAVASGTSVFHLSAARVRKMPFPMLDREQAEHLVAQLEGAKNLERRAADALDCARRMSANLREALLRGGDS